MSIHSNFFQENILQEALWNKHSVDADMRMICLNDADD